MEFYHPDVSGGGSGHAGCSLVKKCHADKGWDVNCLARRLGCSWIINWVGDWTDHLDAAVVIGLGLPKKENALEMIKVLENQHFSILESI